MTYPLVKFVEAPDPAAAVRYDFNRAGEEGVAQRRVMAEGFTLGSPTLEGDPDAVGVTYGFRQPLVPQRLKGAKADALAALSSLSRELLRQTNWLLFQLNATTAPVWLKIYRSGFASLSLREVYVNTKTGAPVLVPDTWDIPVPLVAGPFGYRERVTHDPVTVTQSPADLTGPTRYAMSYALPAIKGDAPTPLRVEVSQVDSSSVLETGWLLGCNSGTSAMDDPVVDIGTGDGFTAGTGTAASSSSAAYFNGSYRTVTIASDDDPEIGAVGNFAERLAGTIDDLPPGRYTVHLRCEADAAASTRRTYIAAFGTERRGEAVYGPTGQVSVGSLDSLSAEVFQGWVDLGEFTFPFGYTPLDGLPIAVPAQPFHLKIGNTTNESGTVRIDALKFIPVDGPAVTVYPTRLKAEGVTTAVDARNIFDGDTETYVSLSATDELLENSISLSGGFPVADPIAEQNLLVVMATGGLAGSTADVTGGPASVGSESVVTVSYHPRYLHLGDGT